MLNTEAVFARLDLGLSPTRAVQRIRDAIEEHPTPLDKASQLIKDILGLEAKYDNVDRARIVVQKVGEMAIKAEHKIDNPEELLAQCEKYADERLNDPKNAFHYVKPEKNTSEENNVQVIKDLDVKVAVKADGKIKKGGKQVLAAELYKKHVLEADVASTNQEFINILMKELGMSKPGATTYAYNCKKDLGEPKGGIVKAKRGRKAKKK